VTGWNIWYEMGDEIDFGLGGVGEKGGDRMVVLGVSSVAQVTELSFLVVALRTELADSCVFCQKLNC